MTRVEVQQFCARQEGQRGSGGIQTLIIHLGTSDQLHALADLPSVPIKQEHYYATASVWTL